MNPFIKVSLLIGSSMEKEKKNLPMEIFLKAYIRMADLMEMELTFGKMKMLFMKEGLKTDLDMGKGDGNRDKLYIKVITLKD